jgi:hypothetical protein
LKLGKHGKPIVGTEIYTFRGQAGWIAAWKRFDIVAQGATEHEAFSKLIRTIALQAVVEAESGNLKTFGSCRAPSAEVLQRWVREHYRAHEAN